MKNLLLFFYLTFILFHSKAQVKLYQVPSGSSFTPYYSFGLNQYTPLVFGTDGTNGSWGIEDWGDWFNIWKPAFGSFPHKNYMFNISPYGKVGIGAKASDSQNYIFQVYGTTWSDKIYTNQLNVAGVWVTSDERLKTDIEPLSDCLQKLCKLEGSKYSKSDLVHGSKNSQGKSALSNGGNFANPPKSNNDLDDVKKITVENDVFMDDVFAKETKEQEIGLMAQDVQKIFPELVKPKDNSDILTVNYIGLIPVIIEALKDQNKIITQQKAHINELEKLIQNLNANTIKSKSDVFNFKPENIENNTELNGAKLEQNRPNPFNNSTTISYFVPQNANQAFIYVFDLNGTQQQSYSIHNKGANEIVIQKGDLAPGMYLYSLIIDGVEIDTKRMILSR
jgi:hypothetical protein